MLSHPVCSPDLSPLDYFVFLKLKMELKGDQYFVNPDVHDSEIKGNIHEREKVVNRLKHCAKECIQMEIMVNKNCILYVFELFRDVLKSSLKTYGTHCICKK